MKLNFSSKCALFLLRQERGVQRKVCHGLQIVRCKTHIRNAVPVLVFQRYGSECHIVGADAHTKSGVQQLFCRMQRIRRLRFALNVARRTDLKRNAGLDCARPEHGIIENMMPVADALCAEVQRVADSVRPLGITCVTGKGQRKFPREIKNRVKFRSGTIPSAPARSMPTTPEPRYARVSRTVSRFSAMLTVSGPMHMQHSRIPQR